jgi:hypothetical protein
MTLHAGVSRVGGSLKIAPLMNPAWLIHWAAPARSHAVPAANLHIPAGPSTQSAGSAHQLNMSGRPTDYDKKATEQAPLLRPYKQVHLQQETCGVSRTPAGGASAR